MKRIIISLIAVLAFVNVSAQRQMVIHKADGSTTSINVSDISKVHFEGKQEEARDMVAELTSVWWTNNSFMVEFAFGADVSTYKYIVFPSTSSYAHYSADDLASVIDKEGSTSKDYNICCTSNDLSENTTYYIKIMTYDSEGKQDNVVYSTEITTATSAGQPRAKISNLALDNTKSIWTYNIAMNSYCNSFILILSEPSGYINYCDAYVAYLIRYNNEIFNGNTIRDGYQLYESGSYKTDCDTPQCEVITWGIDKNGYLSDVLDRASYGYSSAKSSMTVGKSSESITAHTLSMDDVKRDRSKMVIIKQ